MNLKMLEEINLIRKTKTRLNDFRFMSDSEKGVFLRALESYENYLKNYIQSNNKNIEMMQKDGIETENQIVNVPADPNNANYEVFRNMGVIDSMDARIKYLDNVFRSMSSYVTALEIPEEEEKVILKSIREYAHELDVLKKQRENNREYNSDIYTPSEEGYVPLSQNEMFTEVYKNMVEEDSKKTRK